MPKQKRTQKEGFEAGAQPQFIPGIEMGPWATYSWLNDPRHMCFMLSRYKFCAKMLEKKGVVLELGCGDGFSTPIVAQAVGKVIAIDSVPKLINKNKELLKQFSNIEFRVHNICDAPMKEKFDAIYSLDVIEHLDAPLNKVFFANQAASLKEDGICICGTPNITALKYAKELNKLQHINCQSQKSLREKMEKYFKNVFMFSMNDEIVHTGYGPMAHYIIGMGVGVK